MKEIGQAALGYVQQGLPILPCHQTRAGQCTCYRGPECEHPGKHPRTQHGILDATTNPERVRQWWALWPAANIAMRTGGHFVVLDIDARSNGFRTLSQLEAKHGALPQTLTVKTGGGGEHRHFHANRKLRSVTLGPGVELKAEGASVILPPSVTTKLYEWVNHLPRAALPDWLADLAKARATPTQPGGSGEAEIPEGNRHNTLVSLAGSMRRRGMTAEGILAALREENRKRCSPPLGEWEIENIAKSMGKYPVNDTEPKHLTDLGNAERLVAHHGNDIRFCPQRGWLVWDGARWAPDETGAIFRLAEETVRSIYAEAATETDSDKRKAIGSWAKASESDGRIQAMVRLAQYAAGMAVLAKELDTDPWILNCTNGTIDLRTGELRPARREDLVSKTTGVRYDPQSVCPKFLEFLMEIMNGKAGLIEYLQRAMGYGLTGVTVEQVLHLLYGTGANGKTTLLETLRAAMGDYALQADAHAFLVHRNERISNDMARLAGARLVSAVEVERGCQLAEVLVKVVTGQDTVTARFLHHEFFEFKPTFKLFLGVNHKPVIRGTDLAIWRRIRLVPFTVTIPPDKQDRRLAEKLRGELPGILAWMVQGCLRWQRDGLAAPSEVIAATETYRCEMDTLSDFLAECCIQNRQAEAAAGRLYAAYRSWAEQRGEAPLAQRNFGLALSERGFVPDRLAGGTRIWRGIGLKGEACPP